DLYDDLRWVKAFFAVVTSPSSEGALPVNRDYLRLFPTKPPSDIKKDIWVIQVDGSPNTSADCLSRLSAGKAVPPSLAQIPRDSCPRRDASFWRVTGTEGPSLSVESPAGTLEFVRLMIRPYRRGSQEKALAVITDDGGHRLQGALSEFHLSAYASSTRRSMESRLRTWCKLSESLKSPPFPLTPSLIFAVSAALTSAGYRSVRAYLDCAVTEHRNRGYQVDESLKVALKQSRRSAIRGLGPPKRMAPIGIEELHSLSSAAGVDLQFQQRVSFYIMCTWYLLRASEGVGLTLSRLVLDHGRREAHVVIDCSKTDTMGRGTTRTHGCCCAVSSNRPSMSGMAEAVCPYHAVWFLVESRLVQGATGDSLVICGGDHCGFTKAQLLSQVRQDLMKARVEMNPAEYYGTHSFRRGGTQMMAKFIPDKELQLFGRWKCSESMACYLGESLLKESHKYSSMVVTGSEELLRRACQPSQIQRFDGASVDREDQPRPRRGIERAIGLADSTRSSTAAARSAEVLRAGSDQDRSEVRATPVKYVRAEHRHTSRSWVRGSAKVSPIPKSWRRVSTVPDREKDRCVSCLTLSSCTEGYWFGVWFRRAFSRCGLPPPLTINTYFRLALASYKVSGSTSCSAATQ
ncbi:hypothetical protein FOZ63_033554, partial [Perkinsus olseni]